MGSTTVPLVSKLEYFPTENCGISLLATLILVCLRLPAIYHQTPYEREEKSIFISCPWSSWGFGQFGWFYGSR